MNIVKMADKTSFKNHNVHYVYPHYFNKCDYKAVEDVVHSKNTMKF